MAKEAETSCFRSSVSGLFHYDTPRSLRIQSKFVGIVNHLVKVVIVSYIVLWVIILQKGYQETDQVESSVTTKLSGNDACQN